MQRVGRASYRRGAALLTGAALLVLLGVRPAAAGIDFSRADPLPLPSRGAYIAIGDFNRDHKDDVAVVAGAGGSVRIFLGSSQSASRLEVGRNLVFGSSLRGAAIGDVNNDGYPDLVVADERARGVWVVTGKGDGRFGVPRLIPLGRNPVAVAIGDFDGAHGNDIAAADRRRNAIQMLLNSGSSVPTYTRLSEIPIGQGPADVFARDLDGDGHLDLAAIDLGGPQVKDIGLVLFEQVDHSRPVFSAPYNFVVGEKPESAGVADVDADGLADVYALNRPLTSTNSNVNVLLNRGNGQFAAPLTFEVPCPFFTGGLFCRARVATAGDYDGDGAADLAVALNDPRPFANNDALQIFGSRRDGRFSFGAVLTIGKAPVAMASADVNGDRVPDIVIVSGEDPQIQAFINTSTPGDEPDGSRCLFDSECSSSACVDGRCCVSRCQSNERCNVPNREGTCIRVQQPIQCGGDAICPSGKCRDGFCCDQDCSAPGRCDVSGFEGICLEPLSAGDSCDFDQECDSGVCRGGFCCSGACPGACDGLGMCRHELPNGAGCRSDVECASQVCDQFDEVCCDRECDLASEFCDGGTCRLFGTPLPTATGTPTPTATPTPRGKGALCGEPEDCQSGFCVDGVCCAAASCPAGQFCSFGSGACVSGMAPCRGDLNGDGVVVVSELITAVNNALDGCPASGVCAGDFDGDRQVTIVELVNAIGNAVSGCPG